EFLQDFGLPDKTQNIPEDKRSLIGNSKMGWLVREINPELEVLILHSHLKEVSFTENTCQFAGTKFEQLSANSSRSFSYFLGSLEAENVIMLQAVVAKHYPNLFPDNQQMLNAKMWEDRLRSSLKRISEGSSIMLDDILTSTEILIKEGLLFEKHSKALSLEDTQTLMLEYKK
ncbi:16531_t:CDS:2, partial [Gigaspora margarita]